MVETVRNKNPNRTPSKEKLTPEQQKLNPRESIGWYLKTIQAIRGFTKNSSRKFLDEHGIGEVVGMPEIGKMYVFAYFAKGHYDPKLKFYDQFPLTIPFEIYGDSDLSLNLHYLPPGARQNLFSQLLKMRSRKDLTPDTLMLINYEMLKGASRFKGYQVCIKKHLFGYLRSPYFEIKPEYWQMATSLPLARWVKGQPY